MFELLQDIWKPFTQKTEEKWKELIAELRKSNTGLGISAAERDEIVKAMGSSGTSGHWYTCPNGHVYLIGECGGAMQVCNYNLFLHPILWVILCREADALNVEKLLEGVIML